MFERTSSCIASCVILLALLAGCSDSASDLDLDPEPTPIPIPSPNDSFHSFLSYKVTVLDSVTNKNLVVGIKALSLDNLNESVEVDISADGSMKILANGFQSGVYDGNAYSISSYHTRDVIFTNEGKIKRLPVYEKETPKAIQVSSESDSGSICTQDLRRANDYADAANSRLVYKKLAGATDLDNCRETNGSWFMVQASDDDKKSPVSLPLGLDFFVDAVHRELDGGLFGWIVVENGQLKQYDTEFTLSELITTNNGPIAVQDYARLLARTASKQFLLDVDDQLYIYNPYTRQVLNNQALFTAQSNQRFGFYKVADGERLYFTVEDTPSVDESDISTKIYALDLGSGISQELASENGAIGKLVLTNDYVVYGVGATNLWPLGQSIKKVLKSGGASVEINSSIDSLGIYDLYAAGDYFYVNHSEKDNIKSVERISQSDTQGAIHPYHRIIGAIYGDVLNPARFYLDIDYFIVVQSDSRSGEKRLHAINVASGEMFGLGELPKDSFIENDFEFIESLGHSHALVGIYHQGIRDLYYFDAQIENSLQRLGVHTEDNESAIYYKPSLKEASTSNSTAPVRASSQL